LKNKLYMINLIPKEEKKEMVRDFYIRFATIFCLVFGISILIAGVLILPAYFFSVVKKNLADTTLKDQSQEPAPVLDQQTTNLLLNLDTKLTLVENGQSGKFIVSERVINEILFKKMSDIKITRIFYENDPSKGKKIGIKGTAPSRERLLLFRQALEEDSVFKDVDLPISNFIRGSNIQFYLTLNPS